MLEDAWEPLLAIADSAGGEYPERARAAAEGLAAADEDDGATAAHALLLALRDVFGDREVMFSKQLVADLNSSDELPFGGWSDGNGIAQAEMARLLKRYRVKSRTVRMGSDTAKGYRREWFEDAWERYGGDFAVTPDTSQAGRANPPNREPSHDVQCDGSQNAANAREHSDVTGVTAETVRLASDEEEALAERLFSEYGEDGR